MEKPFPTPQELRRAIPLSRKAGDFLEKSQRKLQEHLKDTSTFPFIIVGPCSIHDVDEAIEYANRLKELQAKVPFFLIMRVYVEKARTTIGWKGLVYDPDLNGTHKIAEGLYLSRKLLLNLAELEVPTATECVDPIVTPYLSDLITWGSIGARTSASQAHRQLASSLPFPVGFKNGVDGNIDNAIQGALAASHPHEYLSLSLGGDVVAKRSYGNTSTHVVLRGSWDFPNFDRETIERVEKKMRAVELEPNLVIDCAHGNSQKRPFLQKEVFQSVIEQIEEGNQAIRGLMLESYLEEGSQALSEDLIPGVSITDPCLGWDETEKLILWASESLSSSSIRMGLTQS